MIYVYAITDHPTLQLPELGMPLTVVSEGRLAAICGAPDSPHPEATRDGLWRHEQTVEALMRDRTLLPLRFGTLLPDKDHLTDFLRRSGGELAEALERVRGGVELALRVLPTQRELGRESPDSPTGRDYMLAKARELAATEAVAEDLHRPLARIARQTRRSEAWPPTILKASYLVDEDAVDAFSGHVESIQQTHPDLAVVCTGPWPPYSFANMETPQ